MIKPIVYWAGGKTQLLEEIKNRMPGSFGRYFEPFVGGGALLFHLQPKEAVINDKNAQLVNLYVQVRDHAEELMPELDSLMAGHEKDPEAHYYQMREEYNEHIENGILDIRTAALLLYLNRAGFNALYRTNKKGFFNVPSGKYARVYLYERDNLLNASELLKRTEIYNEDFEIVLHDAKAGDFVFLDSPYCGTFCRYTAERFEESDHERLARVFRELTDKGVYCMLTNSNEKYIKDLYRDFRTEVVDVRRWISSNGKGRTGQEIIVTNYEFSVKLLCCGV